MSVADRENLYSRNTNDTNQPWLGDAGDGLCFYCGKPLNRVAVFWQGDDSYIWLHATCAERLGARLIVDAYKAASAEKGYLTERGIVPSLGGPRSAFDAVYDECV